MRSSCKATPYSNRSPSEERGVEWLKQIGRLPPLVLAHADDSVTDVAVLPEDVGLGVVHVVVRVPPLVGGAGGVPLKARPEMSGHSSSPTGRA